MGLGLHGGGAASARFCREAGANVTITDLRTKAELESGLKGLDRDGYTFVLGEHRRSDFEAADLVIKNPAVPRDAEYLKYARAITTDIALFLSYLSSVPKDKYRLVAVTGSKGKSSTASMIHYGLLSDGRQSFLGGNITVSPLSFASAVEKALKPDSKHPVYIVLELSSFQTGDLAWTAGKMSGISALDRRAGFSSAVLTNIYRDHQDYYGSMEEYVDDKLKLFSLVVPRGNAFICDPGPWRQAFANAIRDSAPGVTFRNMDSSAPEDWVAPLLPKNPRVPGTHQRSNMALAAATLQTCGVETSRIPGYLERFPGVEHRLQYLGHLHGTGFYNDSAATIPQAALAAVEAFPHPPLLIAGGTDKNLDLEPLVRACASAAAVALLGGSASDKLIPLLRRDGTEYAGPFGNPDSALEDALDWALERHKIMGNENSCVVLSPGCASFGLFRNEFDRGRKFAVALQRRQGFSPAPPIESDKGMDG